jgi:hypothetical protein
MNATPRSVADADDGIADCRALGEARDDLADSQAERESGERAAPPGEIRSLTSEPSPAHGAADILGLFSLHDDQA